VIVTGQQLPIRHKDHESHVILPTNFLTLNTENRACDQKPNTTVLHQVNIQLT